MPAARHTCRATAHTTLRTRATAHATARARATAHATYAAANARNAATRATRVTTRACAAPADAACAAACAAPATAGPVGVGRVVVPPVLFERVTPASGQGKQQDQPAAFEDRRGTAFGVHWFSAVPKSIFRAISSSSIESMSWAVREARQVSSVHQNDGGAIQFE
jgi:hypothetical protein